MPYDKNGINLTELYAAAPMVLIAALGGLVHLLNSGDKQKITVCSIIVQLLTSGFVGLLLYYLTAPMNICEATRCFFAGIAGGGATRVLTALTEQTIDRLERMVKTAQNGDEEGS
jgi:hypothetical protein